MLILNQSFKVKVRRIVMWHRCLLLLTNRSQKQQNNSDWKRFRLPQNRQESQQSNMTLDHSKIKRSLRKSNSTAHVPRLKAMTIQTTTMRTGSSSRGWPLGRRATSRRVRLRLSLRGHRRGIGARTWSTSTD